MPVAHLRYKPRRIPEEVAQKLAMELTHIVSSSLDIPINNNARLSPQDIEVSLVCLGENDFNVKDIEVMIWAHDYPERLKNLDERKNQILAGIRKFLSDYDVNIDGWVWILLQPTAFGKI